MLTIARSSWGWLAAAGGFSESDVVVLLIGLLIVIALTAVVYLGGRRIGRPAEASWAAFFVLVIGVLLLLFLLL